MQNHGILAEKIPNHGIWRISWFPSLSIVLRYHSGCQNSKVQQKEC